MKNDGITLISLAVTIIVLLIFAGVSIGTILSGNGVLNQATSASMQTEVANVQEKVDEYIRNEQAEKIKNRDYSESDIKGILGDTVLVIKTEDEVNLGIIKDVSTFGVDSKFGKGAKDIIEGWSGEMKELNDVFVIEIENGKVFYVRDGAIWSKDGETDVVKTSSDSEI